MGEKAIDELSFEELQAELRDLGVAVDLLEDPDTTDQESNEDGENQEDTPEPEATDPEDFQFDKAKFEGKSPEEIIAEMEKIAKQNFHKEKMIQKQAQEVGQIRKREMELTQQMRDAEMRLRQLQETEDSDAIDPNKLEQHIVAKHLATNEVAHTQAELKAMQTEQWLRSQYPDLDVLINSEIPELIRKDMESINRGHEADGFINLFKSGNWKFEDPKDLTFLLTRAKTNMELKAKDNRVEELEAALRKLMKSPDTYGRKMEQVSRQSRNVPGKSLSNTDPSRPIRELTDAELEEELKKARE